MLDSSLSSFMAAADAGWQNTLKYGDIVLFRFPGRGQAAGAHAKARPCLVLDVELIGARRCAVLVPALPAHQPGSGERAVTLARQIEYRRAGLHGPTRFLIRTRLIVPLSHDGFVVAPPTGTPVIGRLEDAALDRLNVERARLHALRDIRKDRAQAQRPQRRERQRDRDFTVTRRGQRRPIAPSLPTAARSGG